MLAVTDEQLKSLCALWQKRLRLRDWRIDVRFVDSGELPDQGGGTCQPHPPDRTAVIKILRPDSYNATSDFYKAFPDVFDVERTLIHELLHIPLDGIVEAGDEVEEFRHRAQEQAIEQITDALYNGYGSQDAKP